MKPNSKMRLKPWSFSNIPPVAYAPWKVELPGGKALHGSKVEVIAAARKEGVDRILDRANKCYRKLDLESGKICS